MQKTTKRPLIKTSVLRERMTPKRQARLNDLMGKYGIDLDEKQNFIDQKNIFGRTDPLYIEIGSGTGDVLFKLAKENPQFIFIGIEIYRTGIEKLLSRVEENELKNVRVFANDARLVLEKAIADNSLDGILIFFPDPWPKRRHHKRRLVQPEFVSLLVQKLKTSGYIHFASDIKDYVGYAKKVLNDDPNLKASTLDHPEILPRPTSKFFEKGTKAGRESEDLIFIKK